MSDEDRSDRSAKAMMRYDANKKSTLIAYLLWIFLGYLGAHRFYLKHAGSGAAMLVIWIVSVLLTFVYVGLLGFLVIGVWWIVDAFLIPGMASDYNNRLINALAI
ncbi:MAG: TM2 domain-containing protein [Proteobacteria bacterium]|nr:TM2 domain-containing protein [Pseudomonadota bacterium]